MPLLHRKLVTLYRLGLLWLYLLYHDPSNCAGCPSTINLDLPVCLAKSILMWPTTLTAWHAAPFRLFAPHCLLIFVTTMALSTTPNCSPHIVFFVPPMVNISLCKWMLKLKVLCFPFYNTNIHDWLDPRLSLNLVWMQASTFFRVLASFLTCILLRLRPSHKKHLHLPMQDWRLNWNMSV